MRGLWLFPTQIIAGIVAAALIECMIPGSINVTQTTLAPGMSIARGVFFEMFLTIELCFTVLVLAADKSKDTFIAPIGIGLALFVAEIAGKALFTTVVQVQITDISCRRLLHWRFPQPSP